MHPKILEPLRFTENRFKIALVGDPHFTPYDPDDRVKDYLSLQYAMIRQEKPDLVVLMGDNVDGKTPEEVRKALLQITKPYADANTPFTFILGNHDLQYSSLSLKEEYEIYASLPCCILPEDFDEYGDFLVCVLGKNDAPALALHHVYSGAAGKTRDYSYYDHVSVEQIDHLVSRQNALNEKYGVVPSVVFQHICVQEEFDFLNQRSALCMLGSGVTGQDEKKGSFYTLKKGVDGYLGEAPCPTAVPNDEFKVVRSTPGIFAMFFGHDHMNDFVGMTDGIILGQVKLSSFNAYGDGLMQGVRILEFEEDKPFTVRTRMFRYRDVFSDDCRSIHGTLKTRRDRTSVKIETALKVLPFLAPLLLPAAIRLIRKGNKHHG